LYRPWLDAQAEPPPTRAQNDSCCCFAHALQLLEQGVAATTASDAVAIKLKLAAAISLVILDMIFPYFSVGFTWVVIIEERTPRINIA